MGSICSWPATRIFLPAVVFLVGVAVAACDSAEVEVEELLFDVSPGPILFISNEGGSDQLYSIEPDGSDVRQITSNPDFPIANAVWSPDGSKILLSTLNPAIFEPGRFFYITDSDGRGKRPVFSSSMLAEGWSGVRPVWSPDGSQLVFKKPYPHPIGLFDLVVMDIKSSETRVINDGRREFDKTVTDWSGDGQLFLGHTDSLFNDSLGRLSRKAFVTVSNTDGDVLAAYESELGETGWAIWSPSEERIAVRIFLHGRSDLYLLSPEDNRYEPLSVGEYDFITPVAWSPDGKQLLAKAWEGNEPKIIVINVSSREVADISPFPEMPNKPTTNWPTSWLSVPN